MKNRIKEWLQSGIVNQHQADQMWMDMDKHKNKKCSKNDAIKFSIIGFVLIAIGIALFICTYWQQIPYLLKVLVLFVLTFSSALLGYFLKDKNNKYSKYSSLLLFLSTIFVGGLILLVGQIYNVESDVKIHNLVLIWLLFVIPFVYIFYSKSIAYLASVLFIVWFNFLFFAGNNAPNAIKALPFIYLLLGIFLYCFGRINDLIRDFAGVSKVFYKVGIFIIALSAFLLTFPYFTKSSSWIFSDFMVVWKVLHIKTINIAFFTFIIMFLISLFSNPSKTKNLYGNILMGLLILFSLFVSMIETIPLIATNIFLPLVLISIVLVGFKENEKFYVNLGFLGLVIFIAIKYFNAFWYCIPHFLFFLIAGIVIAGVALGFEFKKRRCKKCAQVVQQ